MKETQNKDMLYNDIMEKAGCPYLSDLHDPHWRGAIHAAVEQISANEYTADAWMSVFCYITGGEREEAAPGEAVRKRLLLYLEQ